MKNKWTQHSSQIFREGQIRLGEINVPLRGKYAIEVSAAGVSGLVFYSEDICQNVKSLSAGSIFTH